MKRRIYLALFLLLVASALGFSSESKGFSSFLELPEDHSFGFTRLDTPLGSATAVGGDDMGLFVDSATGIAYGGVNMYYEITNADDLVLYLNCFPMRSPERSELEYVVAVPSDDGSYSFTKSGSGEMPFFRYVPHSLVNTGSIPVYLKTLGPADDAYKGVMVLKMESV